MVLFLAYLTQIERHKDIGQTTRLLNASPAIIATWAAIACGVIDDMATRESTSHLRLASL